MSAQSVSRRTGARVEFHGEGAGLGRVERGGDASSPFNYMVFCQCNLELGSLGAFKANEAGQRSVYCPQCQNVVIIDDKAQILAVRPLADVLAITSKR
jgi:hypothetical protein